MRNSISRKAKFAAAALAGFLGALAAILAILDSDTFKRVILRHYYTEQAKGGAPAGEGASAGNGGTGTADANTSETAAPAENAGIMTEYVVVRRPHPKKRH